MPVLRAGDAEATVDPAGGRLVSLVVDGVELLVTAADRLVDRGFYPMVPFAGRVDHGAFMFGGRRYELPCNLPPHAIHGTALIAEWSTEAVDGSSWRGSVALGPLWPLGGTATHEVRLRPGSLELRIEVRNEERAMPATCGWHPWWRRRVGRGGPLVLEADLAGARMYERDVEGIPTGKLVDPAPPPWDDCFTAVARPPAVRWPGFLSLTCETALDHWVLFTEPDHALCAEPQTGPPDAFNLGCGFAVVEPDRPLVGEAVWRWRAD